MFNALLIDIVAKGLMAFVEGFSHVEWQTIPLKFVGV